MKLILPFLGIIVFISNVNSQELPNNNIDDDNDGYIDCFDSELFGTIHCRDFYFGQPVPKCRAKPPVLDTFILIEKYRTNQTLYPIDQRCGVFIADVGNSDSFSELISIGSGLSAYDRLYIFSGVTGDLVQYFNLPQECHPFVQPAVGDVDNDGYADIFLNLARQVYRFEYSPSPATGMDTVGNVGISTANADLDSTVSSVQLADFNQDGIPEAYIENNIYNSQTLELIIDGNTVNTGVIGGGGYAPFDAWPIAYDIFAPGDIIPNSGGSVFGDEALGLELIAGDQVIMVDFRDSSLSVGLTANLTGVNTNADGFTSLADLNGDHRIDIIVTSLNTSGNACIYAWDPYSGDQIGNTFELGSQDGVVNISEYGGRCNIGDFDNDGEVEIGTAGRHLYVVLEYNKETETLEEKWSKRTGLVDNSERTGSTLFDFEGDGSSEVVYSEEESLYIWRGSNGATLTVLPSPSGTRTDYPLVADADGDGQAEIIITVQDIPGPDNSGPGYIVAYKSYRAPWVSAREDWNQHGYHLTNLSQDLQIPQEQQLIVDPAFSADYNRVFNGFLIQTTFLTEFADPTYAVSDITTENVTIDLSQCVSHDSIRFTITLENKGDWKAPRCTPIAIFDGDPYADSARYIETILTPENVDASNSLNVTHTIYVPSGTIDLYILTNHYEDSSEGDTLTQPLSGVISPTLECDYINNVGFTVPIDNCTISNEPRLDLDRDDSGGIPGNNYKKAFGVGGEDGAKIGDDDIFIIDDNDSTMMSATITLINRPDGTNEYLRHANQGDTVNNVFISNYNSTTGQITLTGEAILFVYEEILEGIEYYNTLNNSLITDVPRRVEVMVSDGIDSSNIAIDTVLIELDPFLDLDFDNSSGLIGDDYQATFTENANPINIVDADVYIETNDLDIQTASIKLTNIQDGSDEGLYIMGSLPSGISVTTEYESSVGILVLSGAASPADYQTALRRIFYANSSNTPSTVDRIIDLVVTDIYLESLTASSTISVVAVNDAPEITGPSDSLFYNQGQDEINIVGYDFIVDADDTQIESAQISITNNFQSSEDSLYYTDANGISGTYNAATGVLLLSGTATSDQYQVAIANVTYKNTNTINANSNRRLLTITVNDGDDNSDAYNREIYINVNPVISSSNIVNINNGVSNVITVTSTDENTDDTETYSISGGADASDFSINASSGLLTLNNPANYSNKSSYVVQVTVTDQGGLTGVQSITVNVNAPGNNSPEVNDSTINVNENVANNDTIFDANDANTGNDTDSDGQTLTYSIIAGNSSNIFTINTSSGVITINDNTNIDYETTQQYLLTIMATDNNATPASDNAVITINIVNINDNSPLISDDVVSISEDITNGTDVIDINDANTNNDTDLDNEAISYSIQSGNTDNIFAINSSSGEITINDNTNLDYETMQQFVLVVRASDGSNTNDASITINVVGINDNNPLLNDTTVSLNENATNTSIVHNLNDANTSNDNDIDGEALSYSIIAGNSNGIFTINSTTGDIIVLDSSYLDYETVQQLVIDVRADDGENTDDASVTINITDLIESATLNIDAVSDTSIDENTAYVSDTAVLTGVPIGNISYSLGGNDGDDFTINATNGQVSMVARDYESPVDDNADNTYELTITATDDDGNNDSESWIVQILDVIETATFTINSISDTSINENEEYLSIIPTINGNYIGNLTYTLSGVDADNFTVDASLGQVSMIARDYENPVDNNRDNQYEITLTATDNDDNNTSESWMLTILAVNESVPSANNDTIDVDENTTTNYNVIENDEDLEDLPLVFSIVNTVNSGTSTLNEQGVLTYIPNTDFIGTDSLIYSVCDVDNDCDNAKVIIQVTDINEAPVTVDDTFNIALGDELSGHNLLTNDFDPNGDSLIINTTPTFEPSQSSLTINSDGTFVFMSETSGIETFGYEVCDDGTPVLCSRAKVSVVIADQEHELYDGFSPNGDGVNDAYVIPWLNKYEKVSIKIFNRWGNVVYNEDLYKNNWDGKSNVGVSIGKELPVGTYYYIIHIHDKNEKIDGFVYLNR